jgi:peptide chain release factor subunit 1
MVLRCLVEKSCMFDTDIDKNRICIVLEPPKSITKFIYLCDNRYHTEYIEPLYNTYVDNGLIVITGDSVKIYNINGEDIKNICKSTVNIAKKHNKGGQSAPRFGRMRENDIQQYISKCKELATRCFTTDDIPNIEKLIIAGMGDKKDKLYDELHPKLKILCSKITISEKENIHDIFMKCKHILNQDNHSLIELENFMEHFNKDTGKAIYGIKDVIDALNDCKLEKILVHENYINNEYNTKYFEKICNTNNCQYIKIVDINDKTQELLDGYGGIVGLSWY